MTKLFISYSRKDAEFAHKLTDQFAAQQVDFWIDWEDIPPSTDWWEQIQKGIEEADVFVFLVSPDSIRSKVCGDEIAHALKNGKRLIPVVVRDANPGETPPDIAKLNWIFFREKDTFEESFQRLNEAIHTDFEWVQAHRRLQVKALEWVKHNYEKSYLMRGKDLQEAEALVTAKSEKDPQPTDLQRKYISKSKQVTEQQRRLSRIILTALASIVAAIYILTDKTWYRFWPIPIACPAVRQVSVIPKLRDLPPDVEKSLLDAVSQSPSKTDLEYCDANSPEAGEVVEINGVPKTDTDNIILEIVLPSTPAYQLDFLPEIRRFEAEIVSKEEAVALIKASAAYGLGNYKEVILDLKTTTSLSGKTLLAQAYLFIDEFQLGQEVYDDAIKMAEELGKDPSQLHMGAALAWWRQLDARSRTKLDGFEQDACQNAFKHYEQIDVTPSNEALITNLKIIAASRLFCNNPNFRDNPPVITKGGETTLIEDSIAYLILSDRLSPDNSRERKLYQRYLEDSAKQINLARQLLSRYYWYYPNDCRAADRVRKQLKNAMISKIDLQYYRTRLRQPPLFCPQID